VAPLTRGVSGHMKHCLHVGALILVILIAPTARADWLTWGAATRCLPETFRLAGTFESTGSAVDPVKLSATDRRIPIGRLQSIDCKLQGININVVLDVYGGADNGACGSNGAVRLFRTMIGRHALPDEYDGFIGSFCGESGPRVISLELRATGKGQFRLSTCRADNWDWDVGYVNYRCKSERLIIGEAITIKSYDR
jgi:hypothetical protein